MRYLISNLTPEKLKESVTTTLFNTMNEPQTPTIDNDDENRVDDSNIISTTNNNGIKNGEGGERNEDQMNVMEEQLRIKLTEANQTPFVPSTPPPTPTTPPDVPDLDDEIAPSSITHVISEKLKKETNEGTPSISRENNRESVQEISYQTLRLSIVTRCLNVISTLSVVCFECYFE